MKFQVTHRDGLARRGLLELAHGAVTEWDLVPQMQVSLSRRQHILFNAGVRVPINETASRSPQFLFYIIWDWYDAGLFDAWK